MAIRIGRCRSCGAPLEDSQPELAEALRLEEIEAEYRDRYGHGVPGALVALAESRGLPLEDVIRYASADRLADVVRMPARSGRRR